MKMGKWEQGRPFAVTTFAGLGALSHAADINNVNGIHGICQSKVADRLEKYVT